MLQAHTAYRARFPTCGRDCRLGGGRRLWPRLHRRLVQKLHPPSWGAVVHLLPHLHPPRAAQHARLQPAVGLPPLAVCRAGDLRLQGRHRLQPDHAHRQRPQRRGGGLGVQARPQPEQEAGHRGAALQAVHQLRRRPRPRAVQQEVSRVQGDGLGRGGAAAAAAM